MGAQNASPEDKLAEIVEQFGKVPVWDLATRLQDEFQLRDKGPTWVEQVQRIVDRDLTDRERIIGEALQEAVREGCEQA
jgi:hypothetical protein